MIKHLIFDLYGTLIHTDNEILGVDRRAFWQHGERTWMREDVPEEDRFLAFAKQHGISCEELIERFSELEKSAHMVSGMLNVLRELKKRGYNLHILSNAGRSTKQFVLRQPAFLIFDTLTCSYEIGAIKPEPEAFKAVLKRIQAEPHECIMIGDSLEADIAGARRAGMKAVHFEAEKDHPEELFERIKVAE